MSDAEHLVENIYFCVKRDGWDKFSEPPTDEELEPYLHYMQNGSENISKETLRWLFAMASYVIYQDKIWGGQNDED